MIFSPGSFLWLVAHDLRLGMLRTRAIFGAARPATIALVVALIVAVFHVVAWPVAVWFTDAAETPQESGYYYPVLASAALFVLPWMMAQALTSATRALYSRGDLDLLLAAPISPRVVVCARALAIAIEVLTSVGIFIFPIANMCVVYGGWHWLSIYPALLASALFGAGAGLAMSVGLFVVLGPKRTRLIAQILATFIASAFMIGAQLVNVLPRRLRAQLLDAVNNPAPGGVFDREGLLWLPVRAATGDLGALLQWTSAAVVVFILSAIALGPRFMTSAMRSAGVAASAGARRAARGAVHAFRTARLGASLRRKEWRLLRRDPFLLSQLMLQIIYTLPISVVIWRSQGAGGSMALAVAPCIVVVAAQVSASLAWLAVSSEEAPDFLASAPVTLAEVQKRKLEAIFLPLGLLLAPPCIGLALAEPMGALKMAVFAAGAAASTALLNIWRPNPGRRNDVMRRHQQSKIVGLMEHMLSLAWAVAVVLAILGTKAALAPLLMVAALLWFNRPRAAPQKVAA